jgi:hypothetical protein
MEGYLHDHAVLSVTPRHRTRQGSGKLVTPLFCTGFIWVSALFLLILLQGATIPSGVELPA